MFSFFSHLKVLREEKAKVCNDKCFQCVDRRAGVFPQLGFTSVALQRTQYRSYINSLFVDGNVSETEGGKNAFLKTPVYVHMRSKSLSSPPPWFLEFCFSAFCWFNFCIFSSLLSYLSACVCVCPLRHLWFNHLRCDPTHFMDIKFWLFYKRVIRLFFPPTVIKLVKPF